MRIAISTLSGIGYGGRTYFMNFLPALTGADKLNEYFIFARKQSIDDFQIKQANVHFIAYNEVMRFSLFRFCWEQFVLPVKLKKMNIDVLFTAKNLNVYLASIATVIAIRNMEPFFYRQYKNNWKLNGISAMRFILTKLSMKKAKQIIAVSEFTKNHIAKFFPDTKPKIHVVYNGNPVSIEHSPSKETSAPKEKYLLTSSKYVAYANQLKLLEGYALLHRQIDNIPPLLMAGGIHDIEYFNKVQMIITETKLTEKVRILGLVDHSELIELYLKAFVFIFPSTLEACPQTLIEAMACGLPIAASNIAPMPEICKSAAIYFDPDSKKDIAEKIHLLLSDSNLRTLLSERAIKRSQIFNWNKTAIDTLKVIEEACN